MLTDVDVASAISSIDQRTAALRTARGIAERTATALVDAIRKATEQANEETFGEIARELEEELQHVLRAEKLRKARGE